MNIILKMSDDMMEEDEIVLLKPFDELDDQERNYYYLLRALRETEGDYELDEDWFTDHIAHIMRIYEYFGDSFKDASEAETPEEKQMVLEGQESLNQLVLCINEIGIFEVGMYRDFCLIVEYFLKKKLGPDKADELSDLLEKSLNVKD